MLFFSIFLQISTDESSDCTDYEDIDYVPDSGGNSSDKSLRTNELRITESLAPKNCSRTCQWG